MIWPFWTEGQSIWQIPEIVCSQHTQRCIEVSYSMRLSRFGLWFYWTKGWSRDTAIFPKNWVALEFIQLLLSNAWDTILFLTSPPKQLIIIETHVIKGLLIWRRISISASGLTLKNSTTKAIHLDTKSWTELPQQMKCDETGNRTFFGAMSRNVLFSLNFWLPPNQKQALDNPTMPSLLRIVFYCMGLGN